MVIPEKKEVNEYKHIFHHLNIVKSILTTYFSMIAAPPNVGCPSKVSIDDPLYYKHVKIK